EEDWNLSRAAKRLGIPRNTLRHRLKKLGLLDELRESKGADAADVSRSRSAAEEPMPTETRREPRRRARLRAERVPASPDRARRVLDALLGADRDMIVVSEAAVALLERRFELVPLPVAHGSGPRAYRLVGRAQPAESGGRRMAAFVGRRHNLELLESHLAAAMRGQGQVIGIVGDAG